MIHFDDRWDIVRSAMRTLRTNIYIENKIKLGMTREEVKSFLGEPDEEGGMSKKYPTPSVYRYKEYELSFEPWKDGKLWQVTKKNCSG